LQDKIAQIRTFPQLMYHVRGKVNVVCVRNLTKGPKIKLIFVTPSFVLFLTSRGEKYTVLAHQYRILRINDKNAQFIKNLYLGWWTFTKGYGIPSAPAPIPQVDRPCFQAVGPAPALLQEPTPKRHPSTHTYTHATYFR
jgi:hypothetical protein